MFINRLYCCIFGFLFCLLLQNFLYFDTKTCVEETKWTLILNKNQIQKTDIFTQELALYIKSLYNFNITKITLDKIYFKNEQNLKSLLIYGVFASKHLLMQYNGIFTQMQKFNYQSISFHYEPAIPTKLVILALVPLQFSKIKTYLNKIIQKNLFNDFDKIIFLFSSFNQTKTAIFETQQLLTQMIPKNVSNLFSWRYFESPFSRAKFLDQAIIEDPLKSKFNVVYFFSDIDFSFNAQFMQRCRYLGSAKNFVYMPVLHSKYNPNFTGCHNYEDMSEKCGTWRYSGYGAVCTTKNMYLRAGGFNKDFNDWGKEDVDLYHRYRQHGITVYRLTDPDIHHIWHDKKCSRKTLSTKNYVDCLLSVARFEGSLIQLGLNKYCKRHGLNSTDIIATNDLWKEKINPKL
ncbi:hypothetical protein HZS_3158 [Henneguya salminicola]|nr:hypothetical protein HZS_3158 [Henneguya salminicola]